MKKRKILLSFILIFCFCILFIDFAKADDYNIEVYSEGISCGNGMLTDIPDVLPNIVSKAYLVIQIAVPILLILFSSIDLVKSISAQKEDEIKKNQNIVIKRLISGALVFFVFALVKVAVGFAANNGSETMECAECFLTNKCDSKSHSSPKTNNNTSSKKQNNSNTKVTDQ